MSLSRDVDILQRIQSELMDPAALAPESALRMCQLVESLSTYRGGRR